jgi:hypothetical protein
MFGKPKFLSATVRLRRSETIEVKTTTLATAAIVGPSIALNAAEQPAASSSEVAA